MVPLELTSKHISASFKDDAAHSQKGAASASAGCRQVSTSNADLTILQRDFFLAKQQLEISEVDRKHLRKANQELKDENDALVLEIQDTLDDMNEILEENSSLRDDFDKLKKLHSAVAKERDGHLETIQARNDNFISEYVPRAEVEELVQRTRLEERSRISFMFGEHHLMKQAIEQLEIQKEDLEHEVERLEKLLLMQNKEKKNSKSPKVATAKNKGPTRPLLIQRKPPLSRALSESSVPIEHIKSSSLEKILGAHDDGGDEAPSILETSSFMRQACLSVSGESGLFTFSSGGAGSSSAITASSSTKLAKRSSIRRSLCSTSVDDNGFESVRKASLTSTTAIYRAGCYNADEKCSSKPMLDSTALPPFLIRDESDATTGAVYSDSSLVSAPIGKNLQSSSRNTNRRGSTDMDLQELLLGCNLATTRECRRRRSSGVTCLSKSNPHLSSSSLLQSTSDVYDVSISTSNDEPTITRYHQTHQTNTYPKREYTASPILQFRSHLSPLLEARRGTIKRRARGPSEAPDDTEEPETSFVGSSLKELEQKYRSRLGGACEVGSGSRHASKLRHDVKLRPSLLQTSNDIKTALLKRQDMVKEMRAHRSGPGNCSSKI